jgi:PadR family transcriptional regulator, regulatory protein PadR
MEQAGWLNSYWSESENRRRARFYKLTVGGVRRFESEAKAWAKISLAMASALTAS